MTPTQVKSVLVTGGTGFVGRHLIPVLDQKGWRVTTAFRSTSHLSRSLPATSIEIDSIDGSTDWQPALQGVDTVIHLAARAHQITDDSPDPELAFRQVNTDGTANLVEQCIAAGVRHFVFVSSIGAMATLSSTGLHEESPCMPDTPYGRSKLQAEQALVELAKNSAMTWTILRPALVYGSGNPGNMLRLIKLIESGLPLPLGAIKNRRSFIYVGNLVDIIVCTLTHDGAKNQVFLCSDGQDVSTSDLMRHIGHCRHQPLQLLSVPIPLLQLGGKFGDFVQFGLGRTFPLNSETLDRLIGSLFIDSQKLYLSLNWSPPYSLEEGLMTLFK